MIRHILYADAVEPELAIALEFLVLVALESRETPFVRHVDLFRERCV